MSPDHRDISAANQMSPNTGRYRHRPLSSLNNRLLTEHKQNRRGPQRYRSSRSPASVPHSSNQTGRQLRPTLRMRSLLTSLPIKSPLFTAGCTVFTTVQGKSVCFPPRSPRCWTREHANFHMSPATFHAQLAAIMEVLANTAVAEICELVDSGYSLLQLEISRSRRENEVLRRKLRLMELRTARGTSFRAVTASTGVSGNANGGGGRGRPRAQSPGRSRTLTGNHEH